MENQSSFIEVELIIIVFVTCAIKHRGILD